MPSYPFSKNELPPLLLSQDISIPTPSSGTKHTPFITISTGTKLPPCSLTHPQRMSFRPFYLVIMCTGYLHSYPFLRYKAYAIPNHLSGTKHTSFLTIPQVQSMGHSYPFLRYKAYAIPNHSSGTKHTPLLTISQVQSILHS
jgi:hypothetical protein